MTSTKLHLAIGINYQGSGHDLQGCLNDARDWANELSKWGFQEYMLLEEHATKDQILGTIRDMVDGLGAHDLLVVTYSGHGTWVPDTSGDEVDGRDEAWCPHDVFSAGVVITDDELHDLFTGRKRGSRIVVVSDSCHSGGFARWAAPLRHPEDPWSRPRFLPPEEWGSYGYPGNPTRAEAMPIKRRMASGALTLSGCKPEEFCYDAYINERWNGSYTVAALRALRENGFLSSEDEADYQDWQNAIRELLPSADYPQQHPVLDGTNWQKRWHLLAPDVP